MNHTHTTSTRTARALAAALVLGAVLGAAEAAAGPAVLPDLVADAPENALTSVEPVTGKPGPRLLLRFDGTVHNAGPGRLEVIGRSPTGSWDDATLRMSDVRQVLFDAAGVAVDEVTVPIVFRHGGRGASDRHQHWHTDRAAAYWLIGADDRAPVVESDKVGFCLADSTRIEAPPEVPARYGPSGCMGNDAAGKALDHMTSRDAVSARMGISAGFRDLYAARYFTQWVDLTDRVPPGRYRLRAFADPTGAIVEADEANAPTDSGVVALRGWVARPVSAPPAPAGQTQTIPLQATRVVGEGLPPGDAYLGEPTSALYTLTAPPAHGTVTISAGVARYTPDPGYTGADSFGVAASEEESRLAAPTATVDVRVQAPAAAPAAPGGGAAAAPAVPAPVVRTPRPVLGGVVRIAGGRATVRVTSRAAGRLTTVVRVGGRLRGRCVAVPVRAGRAVTCRVRVPRGTRAGRVSVTAVLVRGGRVVARLRPA